MGSFRGWRSLILPESLAPHELASMPARDYVLLVANYAATHV